MLSSLLTWKRPTSPSWASVLNFSTSAYGSSPTPKLTPGPVLTQRIFIHLPRTHQHLYGSLLFFLFCFEFIAGLILATYSLAGSYCDLVGVTRWVFSTEASVPIPTVSLSSVYRMVLSPKSLKVLNVDGSSYPTRPPQLFSPKET